MPRKKSIQPDPLYSKEYEEFVIEVRDRAHWTIGRGELANYEAREFRMSFLRDLLDGRTPHKRKDSADLMGLLEAPRQVAALARLISLWDGGTLSERTYRRHAEEIRNDWESLKKAGANPRADRYD
jgi:hypothetical protein